MRPKILIVDDDPENIALIRDYLEDIDVDVIDAADGIEAWEILKKSHHEIDLILLDRMMPRMGGMEVMAKIMKHPEMTEIPVIMQTAAGAPEEVKEGILSGVYYYLLKPFDDNMLITMVNAALKDYEVARDLRHKLTDVEHMLELVDRCHLSFQTMSEAQNLSILLASFYNDPDAIVVGISELLINAVEHGNLGITFNEKTKLHKENMWSKEVERRSALPKYINKKIKVSFLRTDSEITLDIKDEGDGFEWKNYLELSPDIMTKSHGRGIPMCKHLYFDKLRYNEKGNEVRVITNT